MTGRSALAASQGCYEASRASALSGVPISTVYDWARKGVVVPSVSPVRERLWSYADLMTLRVVSWLRHPKVIVDARVPASPMAEVRETLAFMSSRSIDLWSQMNEPSRSSDLRVDRTGKIWIRLSSGEYIDRAGNSTLQLSADYLELLRPFRSEGLVGPDLLQPRPSLQIVPLKVSGEPHIAGSRITTLSIDALYRRGLSSRRIAEMYAVTQEVVDESIDLEAELSGTGLAA